MEDVAATRNVGQGLGLAGPEAAGEIGDGGDGAEAAVAQFQQSHAPGVGVAMLLGAEQVTIGRDDIGADENGAAALEDLVVGADADGGEVLLSVVRACVGDGLVEDVVDRPQRRGIVEEVGEQFVDAAEGAVADKREAEDQLPQPGFGHGQPEEEMRRLVRWWSKGLVEGVVGVAELPIDELAADLVLIGQGRDGLAGEGAQGELLSCREGQPTGRGERDGAGRGR